MIPKACFEKIWNLQRREMGAGEGPQPLWGCRLLRVLSDTGLEGCSRGSHMGSLRVDHVDN